MVKVICINDKNKPDNIPDTHWIVKGEAYHVTMVYNMVKQEGILGAVLKEINLENLDLGYSCFRLDRFGINEKDVPALVELAEQCAELNDFSIEELIEEQLEIKQL